MKQELNYQSIKQLLDKSSASLTPETQEKLRQARMQALAHQKVRRSVPALAWIGHHGSQHDSHRRTQWAVALLLVACLIGAATYWQSANNDVSDIDIAILTDDLPVHAYVE